MKCGEDESRYVVISSLIASPLRAALTFAHGRVAWLHRCIIITPAAHCALSSSPRGASQLNVSSLHFLHLLRHMAAYKKIACIALCGKAVRASRALCAQAAHLAPRKPKSACIARVRSPLLTLSRRAYTLGALRAPRALMLRRRATTMLYLHLHGAGAAHRCALRSRLYQYRCARALFWRRRAARGASMAARSITG